MSSIPLIDFTLFSQEGEARETFLLQLRTAARGKVP